MGISFDKALGVHQHTLGLRSQRAETLSANLANADTPGYKARDMNFTAALNQATEQRGPRGVRLSTTNNRHIDSAAPSPVEMDYRVPLQPSVDGNTVDAQVEQSKFMENAMQYQASLRFLSGKFKGLRGAIRGE